MDNHILASRYQHIGIITLNRPDKFNALTLKMLIDIEKQLLAWEIDTSIHAVIINAIGKTFCVGGDIREMYHANYLHQIDIFTQEYRLNRIIHDYKKPYIAWMNGMTFGGGVGISLHGSHTIATENWLFAMPETNIGFFPDVGASYFFARCRGEWGKYLGLTGQRLNSYEAKPLNLITHIIKQEQWQNVLCALIEEDLSQQAYARVTNCLNTFYTPDNNYVPNAEEHIINDCFHYQTMEEIMESLQKYNTNIHDILLKYSPTSLKVTLKQLIETKKWPIETPIKEYLDLDLVLTNNFMQQHDFYEGVRAAIIDKDKNPKWHPQTINAVSDELVSKYFEKNNAI